LDSRGSLAAQQLAVLDMGASELVERIDWPPE
jgi:hypothetical protein